MGTGIGKDCQICENQLTYDTGFNGDESLCRTCEEMIPKVLQYLAKKA